jgi:hemerythrin-like domain-containing protein
MRISKTLRSDQENIKRFLTVLSGAAIEVRANKRAKASFFLRAHEFMEEYIHNGVFKKEGPLIKVLEDGGFDLTEGPIGALTSDYKKCDELSKLLLNAVNQWQLEDDARNRLEVGWAASEYASTLRQHLERLKSLIFPLIEQTIPMEEEDAVSEAINNVVLEGNLKNGVEKYIKLIEELEEELADLK